MSTRLIKQSSSLSSLPWFVLSFAQDSVVSGYSEVRTSNLEDPNPVENGWNESITGTPRMPTWLPIGGTISLSRAFSCWGMQNFSEDGDSYADSWLWVPPIVTVTGAAWAPVDTTEIAQGPSTVFVGLQAVHGWQQGGGALQAEDDNTVPAVVVVFATVSLILSGCQIF